MSLAALSDNAEEVITDSETMSTFDFSSSPIVLLLVAVNVSSTRSHIAHTAKRPGLGRFRLLCARVRPFHVIAAAVSNGTNCCRLFSNFFDEEEDEEDATGADVDAVAAWAPPSIPLEAVLVVGLVAAVEEVPFVCGVAVDAGMGGLSSGLSTTYRYSSPRSLKIQPFSPSVPVQ